MKRTMLAVVAASVLVLGCGGVGFCQDEDGERRERRPRREEGEREKGEREEGRGRNNKRGRAGQKMDSETRERMKEIHEVEKQSMELAKQYRSAETDEKKQTTAEELKSVLIRSFDLKIVNQQKNIEQLEKRLAEFKALLAKREKSRDNVIQKRLEELTGKTEHLKW